MDVGRTGRHCPRVSEIAIIVKTLLGSTIQGSARSGAETTIHRQISIQIDAL